MTLLDMDRASNVLYYLPLHWAASEEATVVVAQELLEAQQEVPTWARPPLRLGTLQERPTTTDNSA